MAHPAHVGVTGGERSEREGSVGPGVSGSPSGLQRPPPPVIPSLRGIPARSARPEVDHGGPRDPPFGRDDNLAMATRCMQGRTTGSATHPWSWNGRSRRTRSAPTRDGGVRPWRSARLPPSATLLPVRVGWQRSGPPSTDHSGLPTSGVDGVVRPPLKTPIPDTTKPSLACFSLFDAFYRYAPHTFPCGATAERIPAVQKNSGLRNK
jgi:hypothetical protein